MTAWLRAALGRGAAAIVAAFCVWLGGVLGVPVSEATQNTITEGITLIGMALFGVLYAFLHKLINSRIAPTDSATRNKVEG